MMKLELGGVVDPELKVYGVKGLRIVDASIMPMIIGSHTSSTVYAVAEKVSSSHPLFLVLSVYGSHADLCLLFRRQRISSKLHGSERRQRRIFDRVVLCL